MNAFFSFFSGVQQFPSLRRIAEACRPSEDVAARVVDAGCGTGALVDFLKEAGVKEWDVTGVDISPEVCMHSEFLGLRLRQRTLQSPRLYYFYS